MLTGIIFMACLSGCGKKSVIEGVVADGKGQPMAGVKVVAQQEQHTKQLEATSGVDGSFRIEKLQASSEYKLVPYLGAVMLSRPVVIETPPGGQTKKMPQPLSIIFVPSKDGLLVNDTGTGLMWLRDAGKVGQMNWDAAMDKAKQFNYAGFSDWRLPTKNELRSLAMYAGKTPAENLNKEAFTNVQAGYYWSSDINAANKIFAWAVNMADGKPVNDNKTGFKYSVWLVRSGK